ncbi:MAG: class I SAM-dependent methyltransferase [Pseudomonadales bacterium]
MSQTIAVAAASGYWQERARELSVQLDLPYLKVVTDLRFCSCDMLLYVTDSGLQLQQTGKKAPGPVWVDFVSGAVAHRRKFGGGTGQLIAKAVGVKSGVRPQVVDVTAGLGRDGFVLATLGCEVKLIERSPVIHALLQDGLARAEINLEIADIMGRMSLEHSNSIQWLEQCSEPPQVVYVDPMFPHTTKSASVKKEMLLFRDVVGEDADSKQLLEAALDCAHARVVVKRPRKAPCIEGAKPSYQLEGKSSRYDVYALRKLSD